MIEKILEIVLLVYFTFFIVAFTIPLIIGLSIDGIEGLKDMFDMLKDKDYYLNVVKPVFIFVSYAIIIAFLIVFLIIKIPC